jgi:hypothetical protein
MNAGMRMSVKMHDQKQQKQQKAKKGVKITF